MPADDPDDWDRAPNVTSDFERAISAVYEAVNTMNKAFRDYRNEAIDLPGYSAAKAVLHAAIDRIVNKQFSNLGLEWPTFLWNGKYIHTFILQQKESHSEPSTSSYHSSSSVGWP